MKIKMIILLFLCLLTSHNYNFTVTHNSKDTNNLHPIRRTNKVNNANNSKDTNNLSITGIANIVNNTNSSKDTNNLSVTEIENIANNTNNSQEKKLQVTNSQASNSQASNSQSSNSKTTSLKTQNSQANNLQASNSKKKNLKSSSPQKIKIKKRNINVFTSSDTANVKNLMQPWSERSHENIIKNPFVPIEFNQIGLNKFFENVYNKNWYAKDFLPNNFMHMTQFLQYGKNTDQGSAFLKSVIKLFSNKIKASSYINCYAFLELIEIMPELTKHYFEPPKIDLFNFNKKVLGDLMYKNFLNNFDEFKNSPKIFLENMAENTLKPFYEQASKNGRAEIIESHVNLEHLRQEITKFLELSFAKLIWSPYDHQNIWTLFYRTAKAIEEFSNKKIIDDVDNLDDIYWSLIHRFSTFLELTGNELPVEFYVNFNNKILSSQLAMFQIEEQERAITSKETYLVQAVLTGQAKMLSSKKPVNA